MPNDMQAVIIPKSDQLNADDLIAGPITVKITGVTIRGGQEQPISVSFDGDGGKPYKPCKSMCRVMVNAWGADSKQYTGRSMTLFRDPAVKWGGMDVGGIRISHMTDIEGPMTMALTATKGSRKPFTVKPLTMAVSDFTDEPLVTAEQAKELEDLCKARGIVDKFLARAKVEKFAQILADDYEGAKRLIEKQKLLPTETSPPANTDDDQRTKIEAMVAAFGLNLDAVKDFCLKSYQKATFNDLTPSEYTDLEECLKDMKAAAQATA